MQVRELSYIHSRDVSSRKPRSDAQRNREPILQVGGGVYPLWRKHEPRRHRERRGRRTGNVISSLSLRARNFWRPFIELRWKSWPQRNRSSLKNCHRSKPYGPVCCCLLISRLP